MKEQKLGKEKDEIKNLKKALEECERQKKEYLTGWQRSRADLLNYKKEEKKRIAGLLEYAGESLLLEVLPILDNFERAQKELPEDLKENDYLKGLLQIKKQLEDFLKAQGVERIEVLGKKFDPNFHEVVAQINSGQKETGTIVEEVQAGYMFKGKLLRPAKVKVAK